jgi:hypothetical protein
LICISLMISNGKHFFLYLLVNFLFWEISAQVFLPIFNQVIDSELRSLHNLDIKLFQMYSLQIFSHFCGLSLHSLIFSLVVHSLFRLMWFHVSIFYWMTVLLGSCLCPDEYPESFSLSFFQVFNPLKTLIHFELFLYDIRV